MTPNTCSNIYRETEKLEKIQAVGTSDLKGGRMGRSDKVSLWYVALYINTRFRF